MREEEGGEKNGQLLSQAQKSDKMHFQLNMPDRVTKKLCWFKQQSASSNIWKFKQLEIMAF